MLKNGCFCVVGENSSRVPWISRRSNQSILREINPECSLKGLMLKLKLQYFGHWMRRTDLLEKTLRKDWRWEEKGTIENEMVEWHHRLNGHESEWTPGDGDGQGGLVCCDSWGCKESDTTEWLTELNWILIYLSLKDIEESKTTVMAKAIIKNTLSAIFNPSVVFKQSCEHATSHLYLAIAVSSVAE